MMFMIGQGERVVAIGPPEDHHCPRCDEVRPFEPQLRYKFGEFDLLFGFVYDKRYQMACTQCNHGWLLDTRLTERELGGAPIPLRLRFGLVVLVVLVAGLGAAAYAIKASM